MNTRLTEEEFLILERLRWEHAVKEVPGICLCGVFVADDKDLWGHVGEVVDKACREWKG